MEKYIGIADAHGLESFLKYEEHQDHLGFLVMRASANRHRHALVYQVELDEKQQSIIEQTLEEEKYILACQILHDPAFIDNVGVEQSMLNSWEMIPNPRLDPYNGRFYEENDEEE